MKISWRYLLERAGMGSVLDYDYMSYTFTKERPTPNRVNSKQAWKKRGKTRGKK